MTYCGIDFGTSNSAIAIGTGKAITLASVENKQDTLPSALFFPPQSAPLYGRIAQQTFFDGHEGRFMRSLKRMLGTDLMNWGTVVNDRPRRFDALIGGFIGHLKAAGEHATGKPLDSVIMGRPVHFVDGDAGADYAAEDQLNRIAQAAGFKTVGFQFEPIAAAFAHERKLNGETLALVADVGGGTSDFTIIRLGPQAALKTDRASDILGNAGIRTGGNDFDKSLSLAAVMPEIGYETTYGPQRLHMPRAPFHDLSEWSKVNFAYAPRIVNELRNSAALSHKPVQAARLVETLERELGHRLLAATEQAKIDLSDAAAATAELGFFNNSFEVNITSDHFSNIARPHIDGIVQSLRDCLATANVTTEQIGLVILTGGPTAMPVLKSAILSVLPHAEVSEENKLSSVALGLGYDAQRRFG